MQKTSKRTTVGLLIIALVLCAACFVVACDSPEESEIINSYEYTADNFAYNENYGSSSGFYETNKTTTDYATYHFYNNIGVQNRNRFVTFAEQLFDSLQPRGLSGSRLSFFVSSIIKTPRADNENNAVYFSVSDIKTHDFINYVLQALNTNTLNYGLLYGGPDLPRFPQKILDCYSNKICQKYFGQACGVY